MIPHFSEALNDRTTLMRASSSVAGATTTVLDATSSSMASAPRTAMVEGPASKRQKGDLPGSNHSHSSTVSTVSISSSSSSGSSASTASSVSSRLSNSVNFPLLQQSQQSQSQQSTAQQVESVTPLHSNVNKKQARRHVSFAPVTDIYSTNLTREQVNASWYSKDELSVLKSERKQLVKVLKKVRFDLSRVDQTVHCLRGYEAYLSIQANKEYKQKRQMVWESVLREQARQRYLRINDTMMMQLVSCHATQWARDTATDLGMKDAQTALQIFLEYMQEQQEDIDDDLNHGSNSSGIYMPPEEFNEHYNNNNTDDNNTTDNTDNNTDNNDDNEPLPFFNPNQLLAMPLADDTEEQRLPLFDEMDESLLAVSANDCFDNTLQRTASSLDVSMQRSSQAHHRTRLLEESEDSSDVSQLSQQSAAAVASANDDAEESHVRRQRPLI